jgi:hypothetical protein
MQIASGAGIPVIVGLFKQLPFPTAIAADPYSVRNTRYSFYSRFLTHVAVARRFSVYDCRDCPCNAPVSMDTFSCLMRLKTKGCRTLFYPHRLQKLIPPLFILQSLDHLSHRLHFPDAVAVLKFPKLSLLVPHLECLPVLGF